MLLSGNKQAGNRFSLGRQTGISNPASHVAAGSSAVTRGLPQLCSCHLYCSSEVATTKDNNSVTLILIIFIEKALKIDWNHTSSPESSHSYPSRVQGSHLGPSLKDHQRVAFNPANLPSWPQFGSATSFETLITKVLFPLGCYPGKTNQFLRLLVKNLELVIQPEFHRNAASSLFYLFSAEP